MIKLSELCGRMNQVGVTVMHGEENLICFCGWAAWPTHPRSTKKCC